MKPVGIALGTRDLLTSLYTYPNLQKSGDSLE
jgi:hypothetical protein